MREMIKMLIVLTILATLSGGLLAAIRDNLQNDLKARASSLNLGDVLTNMIEEFAQGMTARSYGCPWSAAKERSTVLGFVLAVAKNTRTDHIITRSSAEVFSVVPRRCSQAAHPRFAPPFLF